MSDYTSLKKIPVLEIEGFINRMVTENKISVFYQRSLVGAIKKLYELTPDEKVKLNYLYLKCDQFATLCAANRKPFKRQKPQISLRLFFVIPLGFEPRTHTLKVYCSTS